MATRASSHRSPAPPTPAPLPAVPAASTFADAFPHSSKVYVDGARGVSVPMREIALGGGE